MVPDHAQARVFVKENMTDVVQHFEHYLDQHKLQVRVLLIVVS